MRFRVFALGLVFVVVASTSGCICCPWGWHHHRCCYADPAQATPIPAAAVPDAHGTLSR
jgi:hypothetical protein